MAVLVIWLGVMLFAAAGATWLLARRLPAAFAWRDGRPVRPLVAAGLVAAGLAVLGAVSLLVVSVLLRSP
ncbi:MAG TPA: hypothetical protein ENN51_03995 [candidate division WOR-3 bacterium]|uniref:Uncharacterized protein n=1 Tax=candidate division WOR-3 bacterium TaxID=2052148 RepID=A0A7V0T5Y1_UNCW3|nr:hypothetical protein [candidate division WOR-3 bacterium]